LDKLVDLGSSLLSDLVKVLADGEVLEALLLDAGLQELLVTLYLSRTSLHLLGRRRSAGVSSLRLGSAVLALWRLSWRAALFIC